MAKEVTYYSVRTIRATSKKEAVEKVEDGEFDEMHEMCDEVLTTEELIKQLLLQLENEKSEKKG
jgi:dsDNA-binding SOS-regulon protein